MRALILASEKEAEWHPWSAVRDAVLAALVPDFSSVVAIDALPLVEELDDFDLLVNLLDVWEAPVPEQLIDLLSAWISCGGGLLSVHQGISLARDRRLLPLIGARFDGHPPLCSLDFHADSSTRAPLTSRGPAGVSASFSLEEEGYRTVPCPDVGRDNYLLFREANGSTGEEFPAGWFVVKPNQSPAADLVVPVRPRQSAWFMPGHTAASFREPAAASILADVARELVLAGRAVPKA